MIKKQSSGYSDPALNNAHDLYSKIDEISSIERHFMPCNHFQSHSLIDCAQLSIFLWDMKVINLLCMEWWPLA